MFVAYQPSHLFVHVSRTTFHSAVGGAGAAGGRSGSGSGSGEDRTVEPGGEVHLAARSGPRRWRPGASPWRPSIVTSA